MMLNAAHLPRETLIHYYLVHKIIVKTQRHNQNICHRDFPVSSSVLRLVFSKYLRKGLIEFPWAEIATLAFSFLMRKIKSSMKDRTLFSTICIDSPPGGEAW